MASGQGKKEVGSLLGWPEREKGWARGRREA
jgi:hypothetical protein